VRPAGSRGRRRLDSNAVDVSSIGYIGAGGAGLSMSKPSTDAD
jgi:hypothetical protein